MPNKIKITGPYSPAISTILGITYAVSGNNWRKVPQTTTLNDLIWINTSPTTKPYKSFKVLSSNGTTYYNITLLNNKYSCDCVGFKYHHYCKHIREIKDENPT